MAFADSAETGLRKTSEEKILLQNIDSLEETLAHEEDPVKRAGLSSQLEELKSHLSRSSGATYTEIRLENAELKKRIAGLREKLEFEKRNSECFPCDELLKLYEILLRKHAQSINEEEQKTVGEIKAIINRDDLTISSLANGFKIENYNYANHFIQACEKAFLYVRDSIRTVNPDIGISFWLSPKEIVSERIGDDEDKAAFLCSLMFALGDENAEVVVAELENGEPHAFVITDYREKFLLLDPSQKSGFRDYFGDKKEALEKYSFTGTRIKRFMYRFNHSKYEQFQEE